MFNKDWLSEWEREKERDSERKRAEEQKTNKREFQWRQEQTMTLVFAG